MSVEKVLNSCYSTASHTIGLNDGWNDMPSFL